MDTAVLEGLAYSAQFNFINIKKERLQCLFENKDALKGPFTVGNFDDVEDKLTGLTIGVCYVNLHGACYIT